MRRQTYDKNEVTTWPVPNYWDVVALVLILAILFLLGWGAKAMVGHYHVGQQISISLDPWMLPYYALRTVLRMLLALSCSLVFTFVFGTWAAKSAAAERIIIPLIDVLQSVPVLGFLTITVVAFIVLFRGSMLGPEAAAIFAIFTAQVWNMTLSFYQSLRTVPNEMREAALMFQLSGWQQFWKIEVPFAMPGLIWNMMMSMSGSWVFLVAAEAMINFDGTTITLPGIGSYIEKAISQSNMDAIGYVIVAMFVVIALYDQLLFRPLVAWAQKFKAEDATDEDEPESWLLDLFQRTRFFQHIRDWIGYFSNRIVNGSWFRKRHQKVRETTQTRWQQFFTMLWYVILIAVVASAAVYLFHYIFATVSLSVVGQVALMGLATGLRVLVAIIISSLIWVPLGVWIGMNPKASQIVQPIAQFLAAFPANLFFPIMVLAILHFHLNVNIWVTPLMVIGTQWYILFNVVAGTMAVPKNLKQAMGTLNIRGWLWWRRFMLPAIFPFYITGAITAAGGAWNISIIAEALNWGKTHLYAYGLGAFITKVYNENSFALLALGIAIMSVYVVLINRLIWRPLYNMAVERFQIK